METAFVKQVRTFVHDYSFSNSEFLTSLVPFRRPAVGFGLLFVERRQTVHDVHGLHAHTDDLLR